MTFWVCQNAILAVSEIIKLPNWLTLRRILEGRPPTSYSCRGKGHIKTGALNMLQKLRNKNVRRKCCERRNKEQMMDLETEKQVKEGIIFLPAKEKQQFNM